MGENVQIMFLRGCVCVCLCVYECEYVFLSNGDLIYAEL